MAWGVYEGRVFRVNEWAGGSPSTITYRRFLSSGQILNATYGVVNPWNVRPDAMCLVQDFALVNPSSLPETLQAFYVERVVCSNRWVANLRHVGTTGI